MRKCLTKFSLIFECGAVQKFVNLVDLVKSFPTSFFLQNLASIQPRTSPLKFVGSRVGRTADAAGVPGVLPLGDVRRRHLHGRRDPGLPLAEVAGRPRRRSRPEVLGSRDAQLSRDPTNFRGLVLGCIEAKFCK